MSKQNLIILTATVIPQLGQGIVRTDPADRLNDYVTAVRKIYRQIKNTDNQILVLENSNSLDLIIKALGTNFDSSGKLNFLSCPMDRASQLNGISAGEHRMLNYAVDNFDLSSFDFVWKLTGRLIVRNLEKIIVSSSGDMRVNSFFTQHHSCDSRFFGMKKDLFMEFSREVPEYCNTPLTKANSNIPLTFISIEYFLARFVLDWESRGYSYRSLERIPIYQGSSASTGKSLLSAVIYLKITIANSFRKLPKKWLLGVNP